MVDHRTRSATTFRAPTLDALPSVAEQVTAALEGQTVVAFEGEMGAGKTTLIKALCQVWGVEEPVSSPTFALVNEYEGRHGRTICHFDFYRISSEREALDIGVLEYFDSGAVCLIEWPSKIPSLLPEDYATVRITADEAGARTITLELQAHD